MPYYANANDTAEHAGNADPAILGDAQRASGSFATSDSFRDLVSRIWEAVPLTAYGPADSSRRRAIAAADLLIAEARTAQLETKETKCEA